MSATAAVLMTIGTNRFTSLNDRFPIFQHPMRTFAFGEIEGQLLIFRWVFSYYLIVNFEEATLTDFNGSQ